MSEKKIAFIDKKKDGSMWVRLDGEKSMPITARGYAAWNTQFVTNLDGRIRDLTLDEYKRLQTIPDWYEFPVIKSKATDLIGDGWTIDVIAHIFQGVEVMRPLTVLSLFDGISCGRVALERLGIPIATYYTSEIDKYAMAISDYHFPDNIKLGDITAWESWEIDFSQIDLILGGFPCQSWSVNGHLNGIEDARGQLVYPMLRILEQVRQANPDVQFLFENVKMKQQFRTFLTDLIQIEPVLINSSLLSAQNRERLYWTNIPAITQPKDLGLTMNDILE